MNNSQSKQEVDSSSCGPRVLFLGTYDVHGGAAIAADRLLKELRTHRIAADEIVQIKRSTNPYVHGPGLFWRQLVARFNPRLDARPLSKYPQRKQELFSSGFSPSRVGFGFWPGHSVRSVRPELIHLHWINHGFLSIEDLSKWNVPLVWTLHDEWPFTGGCHYADECRNFETQCGECPALLSNQKNDLSYDVFSRKEKAWKSLDLTLIAPSQWMAAQAKKSRLFGARPIEIIPNGVDTRIFSPRKSEGTSTKFTILFGAMSPGSDLRKGFLYLLKALEGLSDRGWNKCVELVVFGDAQNAVSTYSGFNVTYVGSIRDDKKLAELYARADVFVAPSLQDNLPNTVLEALSCGTPCVAFRVGGIPDMIEHGVNGFLASVKDDRALCDGIEAALQNSKIFMSTQNPLRIAARKRVEENFSLQLQGKRVAELYERILKNKIKN